MFKEFESLEEKLNLILKKLDQLQPKEVSHPLTLDFLKSKSPLGFRDAIRFALKDFPGSTPREILNRLILRGWKFSGTTDSIQRVRNEVRRMTLEGHLRKSKFQYYLNEEKSS